MPVPNSRATFIDYCKRRLGYPAINIEITPDQASDRVDDALQKYRDYHFDGTEHIYYKILATQTDVDNQYFTLPEDITGVTRIFRIGSSPNISNLFNIRYQIHLNDLFDYSSAQFTPYVMAMRHIETLEEIFIGEQPIRFNRHNNILRVDLKWGSDVTAGTWLIADCYRTMDPDTYTAVWNDPWLKKYATALMKQQWAQNLSKYADVQLLGGGRFDAVRMLEEAIQEIKDLETDVTNSYSLPVADMMG